MNRIRTLLLATLTAVSTPVLAVDVSHDAFELAIQHFNARHEKDLVGGGAEHRFMSRLLKAVSEAVPALAWSGRAVARGDTGYHDPFRFLTTRIYLPEISEEDRGKPHFPGRPDPQVAHARADALMSTIGQIVEGCPYRKTSTVNEIHASRTTFNTSDITVYELGTRGKRQCAHKNVSDALAAAGLDLLAVQNDGTGYGTTLSVYLGGASSVWRDMAHAKGEALKIEGASALAEALTVIQTVPVGGSNDIGLVGSSGAAGFAEPVHLRYTVGWGDCPAGCINRHVWDVTATPTPVGDGVFEFEVKVTGERGQPLPARR